MTLRAVWLSASIAQRLADHARADAPRETCGVLAGTWVTQGVASIDRVFPITNAAANPETAYWMDESELARLIPRLPAHRLELIGFYHSHPRGDAMPSPTDVRLATYPDSVYLIVGLSEGDVALAAWQIRRGAVTRLDLHIGEPPPAAELAVIYPATGPARMAMIVSAIGALLALIVIALTLLPPAPLIPGR